MIISILLIIFYQKNRYYHIKVSLIMCSRTFTVILLDVVRLPIYMVILFESR